MIFQSPGIVRGTGNASIVFDSALNRNVAQFDGGAKVQVNIRT